VGLSGVELDDRLLVGDRIDLVARWNAEELDLQVVPIESHPIGDDTSRGALEALSGKRRPNATVAHGTVGHGFAEAGGVAAEVGVGVGLALREVTCSNG